MKYYTFDAEYGIITPSADICSADLAAVAAENNAQPDALPIVAWEKGEFGDCWVKLHERPEMDDNGRTTIDGILCAVKIPGEHPGGRAWWCTPVAPVYVPVYGDEGVL